MSSLGVPIGTDSWEFTVRKDVVGHLSIGLYRDFPRAIKELISNSYDAGAAEVSIDFDLSNRRIIISDNGSGMSEEELKSLIDIGRSSEPSQLLLESNRKKIGAFGIGILSVFPYIERMKVFSKKRDSDRIYELDIDTTQFFQNDKFVYIEDAKANVKIWESYLPREYGETTITLENVMNHIIDDFQETSSGYTSIEREDALEKLSWYLAQYSPIPFPDTFELKSFFDEPERKPMILKIMGKEIFRNVPVNAQLLEKDVLNVDGVEIKYCIMSPMGPVHPNELRGLQLRLNDVGIGLPRIFEIHKTGGVLGKLNYLWGEVHIGSGLDSALMISRDEFFFTEQYSKIKKHFQERLSYWNRQLNKWAKEDKNIYLTISELSNSEVIEEDLKDIGALRLEKERMRLPVQSLVRKKDEKIESIVDKVVGTLSNNTDYTIIQSEEESDKPMDIEKDAKKITIYNTHSDFDEIINYDEDEYKIRYDDWSIEEEPSMCKIDGGNVVYNKRHPIFSSKLNIDIIKKMCIGINKIVEKLPNKEEILKQFEDLLSDIFT